MKGCYIVAMQTPGTSEPFFLYFGHSNNIEKTLEELSFPNNRLKENIENLKENGLGHLLYVKVLEEENHDNLYEDQLVYLEEEYGYNFPFN